MECTVRKKDVKELRYSGLFLGSDYLKSLNIVNRRSNLFNTFFIVFYLT